MSTNSQKQKIAFILPRFLPEIAGGAEKLALDYALILKEHYTVEIFTSCAKDYITWKNELSQGTSSWNNLLIHRFPVNKERNIQKMNQVLNDCLKKGNQVNPIEEDLFLIEQGPYLPNLVNHFIKVQSSFSLVIFVGYLYYPIVKLLPEVKIQKLIIPTFHDEPALSLPIYTRIFLPSYIYSFNAPEELNVYENQFKSKPKYDLIGTYVTIPTIKAQEINFNNTESKFNILTMGRMEVAKGFKELFEYYHEWQKHYDTKDINWTSIGSNHFKQNEIPDSIHIQGFVSEEEKYRFISSASLVINPSPYESFSIAMMEAWSYGVPVLVNAKSDVMRGHCDRSQGGLYYSDELSFRRCLEYLINHPNLCRSLGANGKKYVQANFTKEVVGHKLLNLIKKLL
ncbi:MAG: glycosyltransferase family 4 protein [Leptospira sp.]|nr:glycosyltransferase family 4 protein [Leptospira sp.]